MGFESLYRSMGKTVFDGFIDIFSGYYPGKEPCPPYYGNTRMTEILQYPVYLLYGVILGYGPYRI